jgi:dethiobiotin synthetase
MSNGLFITSSGTEIGKTYVTVLLCRQLSDQGKSVRALKPVMSGYDENAPEESDAGLILDSLGRDITERTIAEICPWRFRAAIAPDMAARREGKDIPFDGLVAFCASALSDSADAVLVEGAGGVMAPVTAEKLCVDLIAAIAMPALVVVGSYLGTISHCLTALTTLQSHAIPIAGIVISPSQENPVPIDETASAIERHLGGVPLVVLARRPLNAWRDQPDLTWLLNGSAAS